MWLKKNLEFQIMQVYLAIKFQSPQERSFDCIRSLVNVYKPTYIIALLDSWAT